MTFYLIAEANVRDKEGFNQKFAAVALQIFKECPGEFLARGYENAICIRGAPPESNVMLARFPDMELLNEYLNKIDPLIEKVGRSTPTLGSSPLRAFLLPSQVDIQHN